MTQADKLFSEVREQFLKNGFINWEEVRFKLGDLVGEEIYDSKVGHQYKKIKEKYERRPVIAGEHARRTEDGMWVPCEMLEEDHEWQQDGVSTSPDMINKIAVVCTKCGLLDALPKDTTEEVKRVPGPFSKMKYSKPDPWWKRWLQVLFE